MLDLTEEFYLQTVDVVFQRYLLPKGELIHRGRLVRPERITDIGLLTVEGENDDISGIGQTQAAHALCSGLPDELKRTTSSRTSATTASSTASGSARRSIRGCASSSAATRTDALGRRPSRGRPPQAGSKPLR